MKILAETLTKDFVSIQSDKYGTRAYENTERGRQALCAEQPKEIVDEIMKVWETEQTETNAAEDVASASGADRYKEQYLELKKEFDSLKKKYTKLAQCFKDVEM